MMRGDRASKVIFFDVDGVVVHPGGRMNRSCQPWFSTLQNDLALDFSALSERFFVPGSDAPSLMELCSLGRLDITDVLGPILKDLRYQGTVGDFLQYWFEHDAYVDDALLRLVEMLRASHGYRCYLATNQEHRRASYLWNVLGLKEHFDGMYYSARLGCSKKSPEFYQVVEADFDFAKPPIYFDDREPFVQIASDAGWDARLYGSVDSLREHPRLSWLDRHHATEGGFSL
jgi:putative hydrolase of the HAD superfamily